MKKECKYTRASSCRFVDVTRATKQGCADEEEEPASFSELIILPFIFLASSVWVKNQNMLKPSSVSKCNLR